MSDNDDPTLDRFYGEPVKRLKIICEPCGHVAAIVWEDSRGLALTTADRLQTFAGEWWKNRETTRIHNPGDLMQIGCSEGRPGCFQVTSWQLADAFPEMAKARATGRVVTYKV